MKKFIKLKNFGFILKSIESRILITGNFSFHKILKKTVS